MFCALAENIEFYREKLNLFVAYAPVVRLDNYSLGPFKISKDTAKLQKLFKRLKIFEVTPRM